MSMEPLLYATVAHKVSQVVGAISDYAHPYRWGVLDATITCTTVWILLRWFRTSRQRVCTTELRGPPSESFFYGVGKRLLEAQDGGAIYEAWAQEYGAVYAVPSTLGTKRVILCDPKALAHFHANDTWTYIQPPFIKRVTALFLGKGLAWSHGEDHKRQRKSLTPAFSIPAIRRMASIFYDSAYKAKGAWEALIESRNGDSIVLDVQNWMNHISLDTIGLAGFSHKFGALDGEHAGVTEIFDEFGIDPKRQCALEAATILLGVIFPFLAQLPTTRMRLMHKLNMTLGAISNGLLARTQRELEIGVDGGKEEKSIIGLLIKGTSLDSEYHLTDEEVMSQMKVLLFAGYETTAISLTWTLLELARNPDVQTKLRTELLRYGKDPTYDQLMNDLPYLDAVVHEILRTHAPVTEFTRVAIKDDVIPLSHPIHTKSGQLVDSLVISKGTQVGVSIESINRSVSLWGEDAKIFRPSRWLEKSSGIPARAKEIQGYRHLLTFWDGPKTCLGKNFAVAELKAVLGVLVKSFVFEMRNGVDERVEIGHTILARPMIAGEVGCKVPLRVRPYVA